MIHYITLRAFVHATENPSKVETALRLFIPEDCEINTSKTEGHFGNPITVFTAKLEKRACKPFMEILKCLPAAELSKLRREVEQRVDDDCNFHIRLDKQSACNGTVRLTRTEDAIDIKMKVKTYPSKRDSAIKIMEGLLSNAQVL
ncbi:MAG: RNA-binding domain-containing protein [Methanocellales archaeon]|nr:RNA-binding domain-containing protein [Methanocellales archaeon]